ncbi:trehalose-phosphatase [Pseudaminobacter soli (ex Li et al. 2025)]|uniref:Trehalose 6-phosphate phosphatase n=1 Tax=Pseudaminobacter soli (ex Li et al. 2025) TaxID=1295366 RepID=A0A2P7SNF5_9HYPH|nr:trehalose-phosphatase [Mesorhizobium soli]PSJ63993.1 trehalose-phosphatase [Mesorhizobium soli]
MTGSGFQSPRLQPGPHALFLDIDGTLLEHADHPDSVSVDGELLDLLAALEARLDGALAFVSGRSIAAIDRLFAPLRLCAAGLYGLEHRLSQNGPVVEATEPADIAALATEMEAEFGSTVGVYFERKGPVLAIHTRAAPDALAAVQKAAELALPRLSAEYRVVVGEAGLELIPLQAMKSAAIRRFLALEPFSGRRPIFIGDDTSDESGFELVNRLDGVSIRVRPKAETAARHILPDVATVKAWLRDEILGASSR